MLVSAVNDDAILAEALARSPDLIVGHVPLLCQRDALSASSAYNAALDATSAEFLVFTHQDIYLPYGWVASLQQSIAAIEADDLNWAALGVYGVAADGSHVGRAMER